MMKIDSQQIAGPNNQINIEAEKYAAYAWSTYVNLSNRRLKAALPQILCEQV